MEAVKLFLFLHNLKHFGWNGFYYVLSFNISKEQIVSLLDYIYLNQLWVWHFNAKLQAQEDFTYMNGTCPLLSSTIQIIVYENQNKQR